MSRRNALRLALAAAALSVVPSAASASIIFGTTAVQSQNLIAFDSSTPGNILGSVGITGLLGANERVLGIDFRPANGQLYAVGSAGNLYTLNTATGAATLVASLAADPSDLTSPFSLLNGGRFGVDFNPVPDRLRVISDSGQNLRINPNNGLVTTDADLNPTTTANVGAAYANNVAGAATTTLFTINSNSDALNIQNPPNNGTETQVGIGLGAGNFSGFVGFDIETVGGVGGVDNAYASLTGRFSELYKIDLLTGQATLVGQIGTGAGVILDGLAIAPAGVGIPGGGTPGVPLPPALLAAIPPALLALRKSRRR
jgi:hypothetical protein